MPALGTSCNHKEKAMQSKTLRRSMAVLLVLLAASLPMAALAKSVEEDRAKVREQSREVLELLYEAQPGAKQAIAKSKGYATFSRWGVTLGPVGGGFGRGLAVAKPSGKQTFMRFLEGSASLGLGVKKYGLVFVFETDKALADFVEKGWTASAQATAAAKSDKAGTAFDGATSVAPGVWLYQITDRGLAAELSIKGTKYYRDTSLN
jgi:lipid-binding SYLF domain-containing protein